MDNLQGRKDLVLGDGGTQTMAKAKMLLCPRNASSQKLLLIYFSPALVMESHLVVEAASEQRASLGRCYLRVGLQRFLEAPLLKTFTCAGIILFESSSIEIAS